MPCQEKHTVYIRLQGRMRRGRTGTSWPRKPARWRNLPTGWTSSAGAVSSNSKARMRAKISAFSLPTRVALEHPQKWERGESYVLDEGEAVTDTRAGAAEEGEQVAPDARRVRDRLWGVVPTVRSVNR